MAAGGTALVAAEGAAELALETGAVVATTGSCFAVEATVGSAEGSAAAGCEVERVEVGSRSTCSTMLSPKL